MKLTELYKIVFLLLLMSTCAKTQSWEIMDVPQYKTFDDFEHLLHQSNDTIYVVNFWATWCGPCVKELPYFEALTEKMQGQKFKMILVSLDLPSMISKKLIPFLNEHEIQSDVVILLDGKPNNWIDKVDPSWSGAIPITLVYKDKQRAFYEKEFHSLEELEEIVQPFIKN